MKSRFVIFLGIVVGAVLLAGCGSDSGKTVLSQNGGEGINVNGQGTAYGAPDVADVDIGVEVPAPTVAEAREKAAIAMDEVLKSVKGNGVADDDVRTSQFSVDPQYTYYTPAPGQPGSQILSGYKVTNIVTVRIRKLATVGKIVDESTIAGGNFIVVRRMAYGMLDQKKLQSQARDLAVKEAKERAEELAAMNGRKVGKAVQINESTTALQPNQYSPYGYGVPVVTAPRTGGGDTSIESGQLRVVVNVTINYDIE
jgi:uncharacterized protein YggE